MAPATRVIVHLDLDCFYAQVEQRRLNIPRDEPVAVQQWGSLLAINYVARKFGIGRMDNVADARKKCPQIHLPHVETLGENRKPGSVFDRTHQKAILRRYRMASKEIFEILARFAPICERASIDEAYLDVTQQVLDKMTQMVRVFGVLKIDAECTRLTIAFRPLDDLVQELGRETALYVHQVCQGDDGNDPVNAAKVDVKAFSANKQFDEKSQLQDVDQLKYWLPILAEEVVERCEEERTENKRFPAQAMVYFTRVGAKSKGRSFQIALDATTESVVKSAMSALQNDLSSMFPCCNLCLHVKDFMPIGSRVSSISTFFTKCADSSAGIDESFDQHRALVQSNATEMSSLLEKRKISAFFAASSASIPDNTQKPNEEASEPAQSSDAEEFIDRMKDHCLDFFMSVLPTIKVDTISGIEEGIEYSLSKLDLSNFRVRKERVKVRMGTVADEELFTVRATHLTALLKGFQWTFAQKYFPYAHGGGLADAELRGGVISLGFKAEKTVVNDETGEFRPTLVLNSMEIEIRQELKITLIRDYLAKTMESKLLRHMIKFLATLNEQMDNIVFKQEGPFGLRLRNRPMAPYGAIVLGFADGPDGKKGIAELSGKVQPGYILTAINDVDLRFMQLPEILEILRDTKRRPATLHFASSPDGIVKLREWPPMFELEPSDEEAADGPADNWLALSIPKSLLVLKHSRKATRTALKKMKIVAKPPFGILFGNWHDEAAYIRVFISSAGPAERSGVINIGQAVLQVCGQSVPMDATPATIENMIEQVTASGTAPPYAITLRDLDMEREIMKRAP
ncbi:hypothetical protein ATCC90586_000101 [Pythium insidiosum]|nr:hypothetical protein ATCC90586_000101 [Pythium insidiosum]